MRGRSAPYAATVVASARTRRSSWSWTDPGPRSGSTNFDNRSFRLNDEANLNIYDAAFAAQMTRTLETDKAASTEILLADRQAHPAWLKASDWFWSLFRQRM